MWETRNPIINISGMACNTPPIKRVILAMIYGLGVPHGCYSFPIVHYWVSHSKEYFPHYIGFIIPLIMADYP